MVCFFPGDEGIATLEGGTWSGGPWPTPPAISHDCQVILVDTHVHVRSQTNHHHSRTRCMVACQFGLIQWHHDVTLP